MKNDHLCHRHDAEIQRKIDRGIWRPSLDTGHIYSTDKHANLNETINNAGYCVVGRKRDKLVSRVIWIAAHGLPEIGMDVDHINGNRTDNRLSNLQLITHQENIQKSHLRLTFHEAEQIRAAHHNGQTRATLAEQYGVSCSTISNILRYKTHKTEPAHEQNAIRQWQTLDSETIAEICAEHARGVSYARIAQQWNITQTTARTIIRSGTVCDPENNREGGNP